MKWDQNTCEIDSNSCELSGKFSNPERVKIWHQTRVFEAFKVVLSCIQMCLVMCNWFARVISGPKIFCASFNTIGHKTKQSWIIKFKLRPNSIHSCIL